MAEADEATRVDVDTADDAPTVVGKTVPERATTVTPDLALLAEEIARTVWPLAGAGELKPVIDTTFPLARAAEAHRRMEAGEHVGKIVLTV